MPTRTPRPPPGARSLTGGECGAPSRRSRPPPGWTSPQLPRCSRSDAPQPRGTARARAGTAEPRQPARGRALRWPTRVCSLPVTDAQPDQVAAWIQGHRGIENRLHWVRDVIFDEDRHQLRTANGPQIMATRPRPPGPRSQNHNRQHQQIPVTTTQTSHQTTHPNPHLNRLCRPSAFTKGLALRSLPTWLDRGPDGPRGTQQAFTPPHRKQRRNAGGCADQPPNRKAGRVIARDIVVKGER